MSTSIWYQHFIIISTGEILVNISFLTVITDPKQGGDKESIPETKTYFKPLHY